MTDWIQTLTFSKLSFAVCMSEFQLWSLVVPFSSLSVDGQKNHYEQMAITHLGLSGWCPKTLCCSRQPGSLAKPGTRRLADRPPPPQSPEHIVRNKNLSFVFLKTHLGELEPCNCVAHLTVNSVHTKVAICRIRLAMLKMAHFNPSYYHYHSLIIQNSLDDHYIIRGKLPDIIKWF